MSDYLNYFMPPDGDLRNKIAIGIKKVQALIDKAGGQLLSEIPASFDKIPKDKYLVLIVDNGAFDAAWCVNNEEEFKLIATRRAFSPQDGRKKTFMYVDKSKVIPHPEMWF